MGSEKTSTLRLNLAQAFNPIGSLAGAFVAASFVMSSVNVADFKADVSGFKDEISVQNGEQTELYVLPFLKAKEKVRNNDENVKAYVQSYLATNTENSDDILDDALVDFREGKIESYQGKTFKEIQQHDLGLVSKCYMSLGFVVLGALLVFIIKRIPDTGPKGDDGSRLDVGPTVRRLFSNPRYIFGVVAQMFYVGAQIMVWTFIIQYAEKELGMDNATAANHQIMALVIFLTFRFICTYFLKFVSPGKLLAVLAFGGMLTTLGAIYISGMPGLYSLIAISACMSLMFPTIYGLALEGIGEDAKLGSAGLILAIVGAAWLTQFQGMILDFDSFMGTTATRGSFYLSFGCFVIIATYGFLCRNPKKKAIAA